MAVIVKSELRESNGKGYSSSLRGKSLVDILTSNVGSIGHLGYAATVAAFSFTMRITDPTFLLDAIDTKKWGNIRRIRDSIIPESPTEIVEYMEPSESSRPCCEIQSKERIIRSMLLDASTVKHQVLTARVQLLGDFIDTDAVSRRPLKRIQ